MLITILNSRYLSILNEMVLRLLSTILTNNLIFKFYILSYYIYRSVFEKNRTQQGSKMKHTQKQTIKKYIFF